MDFVTYVLSALFALSGLLVGSYLANNSPNEIHNFKKYIPFLQMISLVFLFLVLYSYLPFVIVSLFLILTFAFIRLFWHKQNVNVLDYYIFGCLFPLSSLITMAHFYVTIIVFIFGVLSGMLFYVLHTTPTKSKKKVNGDVAHHKHKGRQHTHDEILSRLFNTYSFFFLLACISYLVAQLFSLWIIIP